jgi:ABC-type glycerol-3-phosphate transport system permease component
MSHWIRRTLPHLLLIPLVLLWIYPFAWMVSGSFKDDIEILTGGAGLIPQEFNLDNFEIAWEEANFAQYTLNTVILSVSVVAIVLFVSATSGYVLGRGRLPGRKFIVGALVVTMFLPKGYTVIPTFILINALGLNNTLAGVILAESGPAHVMAILLFMAYFAGLPDELEQAAIVDGANYPRIFWSVMLPLAMPVVGTVALFNFITSWNSFLLPLVFTLADENLRTLGVGMLAFFQENSTQWGPLAAGACITIVPVIVVFLMVQRTFIEGIAGAIKN